VTKPGGSGFKGSVAALILACIWINNLAFNIPQFIWGNVHPKGYAPGLSCHSLPEGPYVISTRIINFYVPVVITWTAYIGIIYKIRQSSSKAIL